MDDVPRERRSATALPLAPLGRRGRLNLGEDYYVSDKRFGRAAYAHAKSHGLIVTTALGRGRADYPVRASTTELSAPVAARQTSRSPPADHPVREVEGTGQDQGRMSSTWA